MTSKVIVLTTGGTIAHRSASEGPSVMDFDPERLRSALDFTGLDISFDAILHKGSMDMTPDDWEFIAAVVIKAMSKSPRGVVILHGTDTLGYTASALSFLLRDLGAPVVLTGSMRPGGDPESDAIANLRDAIRVASEADLAEVCVVFSADEARSKALVIRGARARKMHSLAVNAFASVNAPPLGYVCAGDVVLAGSHRRRQASAARLDGGLDRNVAFIKAHPSLSEKMLMDALTDASGAVLEGTGVGHIRSDLLKSIAQFGKPVAITSQAIYGGESLGIYEVDKQLLDLPNVIKTADMVSETAYVKLMWSLHRGGDVRQTMQTNIAGEIAGGCS